MTEEIRYPSDNDRSGDRSGSSFVIRHSSFFRIPPVVLRHGLALTACIALAQQPAPPLPDEEDLPPPDDSWDFTNRPGLNASMRRMLDKLVAVGRTHEGLRYPVYSDGKTKGEPARKAEFQSERVSRVDETWLQFTKATFQSFGDPAAPDKATRMVALEDAIYDIKYDLIFTSAPVKIEDRAGSIHSGAMLHDHTTGVTIFSGGVELYLYEKPDAAVPAAAAPASTPPAGKPTPKPATP